MKPATSSREAAAKNIRNNAPKFLEEIQQAKSIIIGTHLNPDGDAIGSALGVAHFLKSIGRSGEVLCHHQVPKNLEFLPGTEWVRQDPTQTEHDLAIVVDLESLDRLGRNEEYFRNANRMVLVDHHVPHYSPGDLRFVDTSAAATALILTQIYLELRHPITPEMATCLLTGIVTDTGSFRFRNTTAEALSIAAVLLEQGADINTVSEEIFQRKPLNAVKLFGHLLETMELAVDNRLVWGKIYFTDFQRAGATDEDTEGFVNELLAVDTADIAMLIREQKPGKVRVSVRSKRGFDVAAVVREFGGGGHKNAAGCTFEGPLDPACEKLVERLKSCLASS